MEIKLDMISSVILFLISDSDTDFIPDSHFNSAKLQYYFKFNIQVDVLR